VQVRGELQLGHQCRRPGPVGLVHREHVGGFHQAGLHRLDRVPRLRHQHDDRRVGELHDVELGLAHPDGLHQHPVVAEGRQQLDDFPGGAREATERAPGGHRADENAGVERVRLHANPVAEHRAPRERTGGIDRHDPDGGAVRAQVRGQTIHHGGLPRSGRPGDAHHVGRSRPRINGLHDRGHRRAPVLDLRDQPRQRQPIALEHPLDEHGWIDSTGSRVGRHGGVRHGL
jgi:hypothetical protein